ncbi:MAG: CHAT domain-containing tetratricopeptide repeat protein [Candidatus Angelobacter sp.]
MYADARSKFDHSRLQADRNESEAAAEMALRGMLNAAGADQVWSYKFRILRAEITVGQNPKEALDLLSAPPPTELSSGEFASRRRITQGLAYALENNFSQAQNCFDEAAGFAYSSKPELLVAVAFDQAYLATLQKNDAVAEERYRKAIDLAHEYKLGNLEANARINLGKLFMDRELYDKAINEFTLSLGPARSIGAAVSEQMALGNMGWSYFQLGDFENANPVLAQAAEIAAQIHATKDQERWFRNLGVLFYVQDNFSEAENYYSKALALAQTLGEKDVVAINYHNLAQLELKRNRLDKAEDYNQRAYTAEGLTDDDTSDPYLPLTSAEIADRQRDFPRAEKFLKAVLLNPKTDSSLRWQAQSDLANVYVSQNQNAKAEALFVEALHTVEAARRDVNQEDRRMSILDAWPFYDDYIRFLVKQNNPVKALQIAEFSRGRTLAEAFGIADPQKATGLRIPAVQNFLRQQNKTILAYWISDQESYLWTISPRQFKLFHLPERKTIEHEIDSYGKEVRDHAATESSTHGEKLYGMLIAPAQDLLSSGAKIVIVPNRSLYKLNFESLVVPGKSPHYWIEDAVVENASSIALLVENRHRPSNGGKKLLLMGAPTQATDAFPSLRFANEEIGSVRRHFRPEQETVIAGKDATPSAYMSVGPGAYQYIHLVTHGTASETRPLDSAIILSSDTNKSFKLYARDIKEIGPLRADLVTISACYGAGEKAYSGEGLVGLAWAFMRAGSHQVVAALWEVDDSIMPRLMDNFYADLESGKSAPEALRTAKLAVLHSKDFHKRPYYWASLQLYTGS